MQPGDFTAPVTAGEYPHTSDNYVCPSHLCQGFAPTNFTSTRIPTPPFGQVAQSSTFDDQQVARLSYVANECLMPRKKFSAAFDTANPPGTSNLCLVNQAEVDNIQGTIFLAEFSNSCNCIFGSFSGGGSTCKSQRPTNGVLNTAQANSVFNGEIYSSGSPDTIYKLTYGEAMNAIKLSLHPQRRLPASIISPVSIPTRTGPAAAITPSPTATSRPSPSTSRLTMPISCGAARCTPALTSRSFRTTTVNDPAAALREKVLCSVPTP